MSVIILKQASRKKSLTVNNSEVKLNNSKYDVLKNATLFRWDLRVFTPRLFHYAIQTTYYICSNKLC